MTPARPRLAVVSPFLDRRHGTERALAEQLERLAGEFEIHLYSSRVAGLDLARVAWHRVPDLPGPHLARFLVWYFGNRFRRWRDGRFGRLAFDLVFSPGINCSDAGVIAVHMVFTEMSARAGLGPPAGASRLRALHRRFYYALLRRLERRIYSDPNVLLAPVSRQVAGELRRNFGRTEGVTVIHHGVDAATFNPVARFRLRTDARRRFALSENEFAILMIGNGWQAKGLPALIDAFAQLAGLPARLLVLGEDERAPYRAQARRLGCESRVQFFAPEADVLPFYAAADVYAGPSRYDSFGLPVLEAMACGLPVVVSRAAGASECVADGADGLILEDPADSGALAGVLRRLAENAGLRARLGEAAVLTAHRFTWEENAARLAAVLREALARKGAR